MALLRVFCAVFGLIAVAGTSRGQESVIGFAVLFESKCTEVPTGNDDGDTVENCGLACDKWLGCEYFTLINENGRLRCKGYSLCGLVSSTGTEVYRRIEGYIETVHHQCNGTTLQTVDASSFTYQIPECLDECTQLSNCAAISYEEDNCSLIAYDECTSLTPSNNSRIYKALLCPSPPEIANGRIANADYYYNDTVEYSCSDNYSLGSNTQMICKQANRFSEKGHWEGTPPSCIYDNYYQCGIICFQEAINAFLHLRCSDGFQILVIWANFGWVSSFECVTTAGQNTECLNATSNEEIKNSCDGMQECVVTVDLDHSCPGTTSPYLQGEYKCVQNLNTDNELCEPHPGCTSQYFANGEKDAVYAREESSINFTCNAGYEIDDSDGETSVIVTCLRDGTLETQMPSCSVIHCPTLQAPEHGQISTNDTEYQTAVNFTCDIGYELNTAESTKVCESDKEWQPMEAVACLLIHCPALQAPEHGQISTNDTEYQTAVNFTCDIGYDLNTADSTKVCESDKAWQPVEAVSCLIKHCPALSSLENGQLSTNNTEYSTEVVYTCDVGYELNSTVAEKNCQANEEWSPEDDFICSIVHCPELETPVNGQLSTIATEYATTVTYICDEGYKTTPSPTKLCKADKEWEPTESISCEVIHCPALQEPTHGQISSTETQFGTEVIFSCEIGYELNTEAKMKVCKANEDWDPAGVISCLIIDCQNPPESPANGDIQVDNTTYGSVVTYSCNTGYLLQGNSSISCQSDKSWNGDSPHCQVLERYTQVVDLQTSLDCDDYSAFSLRELLDLNLVTLKDFVSSVIETLPDDARHLVIVTVVGIRCNSPLSFVVEVELGNLLSAEETMDHLSTVTSSLVGSTVSLQDASGSSITVDIQDSEVAENKAYQCSLGYYLDTESGSCLPCPKHTYQPTGIKELCWPCPRGTYTEGDATYGEEAEVCLTVKSEGATALIGVGIGIPAGFIALLFVVLGFHAAMKSSKVKKDLEQYSVRKSQLSTRTEDYYSYPYVSRGRRYNSFHR